MKTLRDEIDNAILKQQKDYELAVKSFIDNDNGNDLHLLHNYKCSCYELAILQINSLIIDCKRGLLEEENDDFLECIDSMINSYDNIIKKIETIGIKTTYCEMLVELISMMCNYWK